MPKTIREAYGEALARYGKDNRDVVVLDADVSSSTKTSLFRDACPERFFNVGIAEANMVAMAAGLATTGKIPFVNAFAVFLASIGLVGARTFGSYAKLPVKLMGAYSGLSDAFDGPSHHAIEDIAVMRSLPGFKVYVAGDAAQTGWLVRHAIQDRTPMYIRLSRDAFPDVYPADAAFEDGKGNVLRDGNDATVIANGVMIGAALTAADLLAEKGIAVRVVDMFCVKPLDEALVRDCAARTGAIVTAEEHTVMGGLGSAVAETLCRINARIPLGMVGLQDCHAECGPYGKLLEKYHLDAEAIIAGVYDALSRK